MKPFYLLLAAILLVTACQKNEDTERANSTVAPPNTHNEFKTDDLAKATEEIAFTPTIPKTLPIEAADQTYTVIENKKDQAKETFILNATPKNKDDGFIYISYSNELSDFKMSGDNIEELTLKDGTVAYFMNGFVQEHEGKIALMLTWKKDGYEYFISYNNANFTEEENKQALIALANDIYVK